MTTSFRKAFFLVAVLLLLLAALTIKPHQPESLIRISLTELSQSVRQEYQGKLEVVTKLADNWLLARAWNKTNTHLSITTGFYSIEIDMKKDKNRCHFSGDVQLFGYPKQHYERDVDCENPEDQKLAWDQLMSLLQNAISDSIRELFADELEQMSELVYAWFGK